MKANIYLQELRVRVRSIVIWSLSITALILFFFSIYPSFSSDAVLLDQMMAKFPPALRDAFGMGNMNLATPLGYFAFLFIFVQLCVAIQAGNYGFGLVSIEESELTADFLLTKPVSRTQILVSKLLAALTSLAITDVVIWGATFLAFAIWNGGNTYDGGTLILLLVSVALLQLFFLAVGLVISLLVRRIRSVTPYSLGLAFGSYVLAAFSGILGDVKLEYITPFKHFDPGYIVEHNAFNTPLLLLNLGIVVLALAVSFWRYLRRDIHAVS